MTHILRIDEMADVEYYDERPSMWNKKLVDRRYFSKSGKHIDSETGVKSINPNDAYRPSNELKKCYLYVGLQKTYISDCPANTSKKPSMYKSFSDAYEAAGKYKNKEILYSDGLKDEVCDFYGNKDYYEEHPEQFFNPEEPLE